MKPDTTDYRSLLEALDVWKLLSRAEYGSGNDSKVPSCLFGKKILCAR
jgi:hypothetical protein